MMTYNETVHIPVVFQRAIRTHVASGIGIARDAHHRVFVGIHKPFYLNIVIPQKMIRAFGKLYTTLFRYGFRLQMVTVGKARCSNMSWKYSQYTKHSPCLDLNGNVVMVVLHD